MNSLLRYLLSTMIGSGVGEQFDGSKSEDLVALTDMLKKEKAKNAAPTSMDRLSDAFKQLKDMHKDDPASSPLDNAQWPAGPVGAPSAPNQASPLDNAHWPFGPQGAPSQAHAQAPTASAVPMPMARPDDAPQAPPEMSWFARNTAMMRDPVTGEPIDPQAAAQAGNKGILNGLFG